MTCASLAVIGVTGMGQAIAWRQGPRKTVVLAGFTQETSDDYSSVAGTAKA
jgi:hypothetical protein